MGAHWDVPDPPSAEGSESQIAFAFSDTWRMLQSRINTFVALPISGLDRISLQTKLDAIGKTQNTPSTEQLEPAKAGIE